MARNIEKTREKRSTRRSSNRRNTNLSTPNSPDNEDFSVQSPQNQIINEDIDNNQVKSSILSKLNFLRFFRSKKNDPKTADKKKNTVNSRLKNRDISDGNNFKVIYFIVYIVIFVGAIGILIAYIFGRESHYVTKNKTLFVTAQKHEHKEKKKEATPLIDTNTIDETSDTSKTIVDEKTYKITEVVPRNLGKKRLDLSDFLNFISHNREGFCKYVEQTRLVYIIVNNEIRDYSSTSYPVSNDKLDYTDCMDKTLWKEADLFNLYNNIYDDYINTSNKDNNILQKINTTKDYNLHFNYNPVRDMPSIYKDKLLSENDFIQIFKGNYVNQILFCDYSNKFSKAYDTFVSKRSGSLKPVSNCYSQNVNNQEAYTQYVFYYNYIQPTSKDVNVKDLQTALVPNN